MCGLRQISHEAIGGRCCRCGRTIPHEIISREANVGESMNLQSRRVLLKQFAPQYREAPSAQKGALLDTFALATGYHRRHAMCLLNHAEECRSQLLSMSAATADRLLSSQRKLGHSCLLHYSCPTFSSIQAASASSSACKALSRLLYTMRPSQAVPPLSKALMKER